MTNSLTQWRDIADRLSKTTGVSTKAIADYKTVNLVQKVSDVRPMITEAEFWKKTP